MALNKQRGDMTEGPGQAVGSLGCLDADNTLWGPDDVWRAVAQVSPLFSSILTPVTRHAPKCRPLLLLISPCSRRCNHHIVWDCGNWDGNVRHELRHGGRDCRGPKTVGPRPGCSSSPRTTPLGTSLAWYSR